MLSHAKLPTLLEREAWLLGKVKLQVGLGRPKLDKLDYLSVSCAQHICHEPAPLTQRTTKISAQLLRASCLRSARKFPLQVSLHKLSEQASLHKLSAQISLLKLLKFARASSRRKFLCASCVCVCVCKILFASFFAQNIGTSCCVRPSLCKSLGASARHAPFSTEGAVVLNASTRERHADPRRGGSRAEIKKQEPSNFTRKSTTHRVSFSQGGLGHTAQPMLLAQRSCPSFLAQDVSHKPCRVKFNFFRAFSCSLLRMFSRTCPACGLVLLAAHMPLRYLLCVRPRASCSACALLLALLAPCAHCNLAVR